MKFINYKHLAAVSGVTMTIFLSGCASVHTHPIAQKIDQDMVLVEGGTFTMGSNSKKATKAERPAREVVVDSFYIAKFEVTQELFESVMGSSLSYFKNPQIPVNNLSWQQANYFVELLNELTGEEYRLPTEAEWEFAAKGGNRSKGYTYSGSNSLGGVAWYPENSKNSAHPVGLKKPNELGLYDMTGNVGEFVIDALRSGNGDWRNKFGIQLGLKYIDAFNVSNLDVQAEYNLARPYFHASDTAVLSYTNYRNPLAHPLGANFKEFILAGRYQPINKLTVIGKIIRSTFGEDENGLNNGGNLLLSTDNRIGNLGNTIGQGVATTNTYLELTGSYMLLQNLFVDLKNIYRKFDSAAAGRSSNSFITMLSLRWNLPQRHHEF